MKILLAYIHYPVCSGRYVKDALQRLGIDVKSVGYSTGDQIWNMKVSARHTHHPDGALTATFPNWTPDLVIVMESAWAYHHPVYASVPHVIYGMDNHVRDYRQDGIAHYFLAHNAPSIMDMSADDVTWLPCGYDPVAFTPSPIPFAERAFDVALVGVMYIERIQIMDKMREAGLKVAQYTGLLYDEYASVYHNSKIALNVSAKGDLNQRIFETSALGCIVLTDECKDLDDITDRSFTAVMIYKSPSDAIKKAKVLVKLEPLAHDTAWLKSHTWDERATVIIKWYKQTYPKAKPKKGKSID